MLEGLRGWWARRRKERAEALMFERAVVLTIDDVGISAAYPTGDVQRIAWPEVEQVTIETNDSGPWGADLWWVLTGTERVCSYPNGATGEQEALAEFRERFPQFSDEAVTEAMCCTSNAQFVCWNREHAV
jgi:hypothetical protein